MPGIGRLGGLGQKVFSVDGGKIAGRLLSAVWKGSAALQGLWTIRQGTPLFLSASVGNIYLARWCAVL